MSGELLTLSNQPSTNNSETRAHRGIWLGFVRVWRQFLALTCINLDAVCEQSASLGPFDYHTHNDDIDEVPWGTTGGARCKRCGKKFRL